MKPLAWILFIFMSGCSVSPPDILDVSLPSNTDDEMGPYLIAVHTWGAVDSAHVDWRVEPGSDDVTIRLDMVEVRANQWSVSARGVPVGSDVSLRIILEGPGGEATYPSSGRYTFSIMGTDDSCNPACPNGQRCVRSQCIPDGCTADDECPGVQICRDSRCEDPPDCRADEDCPPGQTCQDEQCMSTSNCGEGCPEGLLCHPDTDQCVSCFDDIHCQSGRCDSSTNECVACVDDADCMAPEQCVSGVCDAGFCGADDNEPNDLLPEATPVAFDMEVEGQVCEQDIDIFVADSDSVRVEVEVLGADQAGGITLISYDTEGRESSRIPVDSENAVNLNFRTFGVTATAPNGPQDYRLRVLNQGVMCVDNRFEPNDVPAAATTIGASGARVNAQLCQDDDDWFRIRQRRRDRAGVALFKTTVGALSVHLISESGQSIEEVVVGPSVGRPWLAIPYGDRDENLLAHISCRECPSAGSPYWLATRPEAVESCSPDPFEPNDEQNAATRLTPDADIGPIELTVCGGRDDWYLLRRQPDQVMELDIDFLSQRGDIDVLVYTEDMELVRSEITGTDGHRILLDNELPSGEFFVQIALFGSGENQYRLNLMEN